MGGLRVGSGAWIDVFEIGGYLHDVAAGGVLVGHLVGEELVAGDRCVVAVELLRAQAAIGDQRVEGKVLGITLGLRIVLRS